MNISDLVPHPDAVMIQTNTSCNLSCKFCFYGQKDGYDTGELMAEEVLVKVLNDLVGSGYKGRVSLFDINEPMTDPRIFDFLALAREKLPSCEHKLTTNGLLLDQEKLDRLTGLLDVLEISQYGKIPKLNYSSKVVQISDKRGFYHIGGNNRGGNLIGLANAERRLLGSEMGPCMNVLGQLVIVPPSNMILCCADGMHDVVIGDVRSENVMTLWSESPLMNEYRIKHASGRRSELKLCSGCSVEGFGYSANRSRRHLLQSTMVEIAGRVASSGR